jgi:hypothetical protein
MKIYRSREWRGGRSHSLRNKLLSKTNISAPAISGQQSIALTVLVATYPSHAR